MKIKKFIIWVVLNICRIFLLPTKIKENKITFISLESSKLTGDFKLISRALEDDEDHDYDLNYILVKFEKTLWGNIKYFFICIKQLHAIYTSKLIILDYNNYVVADFKRRGVKVLQLWHSSGAIKKFGNQTKRDYMIKNYAAVICNTDYFKNTYAESFGVDPKKVKVTGVPRTDMLFSKRINKKNRKRLLETYPQLKGKKVILYAPTFRGKLMHGFKGTYLNMDKLKDNLGDEYALVYKMHPLLDNKVIANNPDIICANKIGVRKLFSITDCLISDYSAIIIDYSVYNKPMIFYVPDLEEYTNEVGLNVDYLNEMPGPVCFNEDEVIQAINNNNFDLKAIKKFRDKMFKYQDGNSLKRVVKLINKIMGV